PNSATPCTGWPGVLAGTGLEFAPTQYVTMLQVLQDPTARARFESLDFADIDFSHSSLANLPFAAVALGGVPLSHLAFDPSRGATPLAQWCSLLGSPSIALSCANDFGIDLANPAPSDDDVTLITLGLASANFDAPPLDQITVTGTIDVGAGPVNVLTDSPLGVASINDLDLGAAGIGHIGIGHIGIGHIGIGHIGIGHIALDTVGIGHIGLNES